MKKKRSVKKIITLVLSLLVIGGLVALPFALDKMNDAVGSGASILSATVNRGEVSRTVSGAGTLQAKSSTALTVPEGVVITGYTVADGDLVKTGDPIATVDSVSVYSTAASLADSLAEVTEELAKLQNSSGTSTTLYSSIGGTVTALYAAVGDDVREVMDQHGALCEVTLDNGTVLTVTATSGTVAGVYIREGRSVYEGASLFLLNDVDNTGGYGALVLKRQKIEDQMAQLFQMLRDGYAAASADGMVTGTDKSLVKEVSYLDEGGLLFTALADSQGSGIQDSTTEPTETKYLSGLLMSALDKDKKGTVMGVNGLLDFTEFPDAKKGDTVFLRADTYVMEPPGGGGEPVTVVEYTVLLVVSGSQNSPGGGGMDISGMTGGMSMGSSGSFSVSGTQTAASDAAGVTQIASVVPIDEVRVDITVDELDILSLQVGASALVTVDALPGRAFEGVVTAVNTSQSNSGGNSKYAAEVTLPMESDMLAGMNASCLITVETFKDVLTIPAAAVVDEASGPVVYTAVSNDGLTLLTPVPVELGVSDGEQVEVLSGLTEGQLIWYSTYDTPEYSVPGK